MIFVAGTKRSLEIIGGGVEAIRKWFRGVLVDVVWRPCLVVVLDQAKEPNMAPNRVSRNTPFEGDCLPLDSARAAFEWLVTGADPVSLDGRYFPGLPARRVPLDELRDLLTKGDLPLPAVDLIWMHLVTRSRDEGGTWTVACVGVALPALFALAAELCAPYADDPRDIHTAILTGFLSELARIDLARPRILWRLRCAALREGHRFIRHQLERPMPCDKDFHSSTPTPPWGHPDLVLARAVAEDVITGEQAELIGSTRLEPEYTLSQAAADWGISYKAIEQVRRRAEHRLIAWLREQAPEDDPSNGREGDVEIDAVHAVTVTGAARDAARPSPMVTGVDEKSSKKVRSRVLKTHPKSGVEGRGRAVTTPAHTTSPTRPAATTGHPTATTSKEPRCA
jgi:hypothetical protein